LGANTELQLLCKIVELQDFHTVEKLKIDETFFLGDASVVSQTREAFRFIRDHYHNDITYGSVPSWALVQQRFYGFPWTPSWDTVPTLCQELRRLKLRSQILTLADELNQKAEVDPNVALEVVREAATTLVSQHELSGDMLLSAAGEQLYENYQLVASGHGLTGIPWPWDVLNDDTQGIHKGNFIVVYGRPKSMKTWMALYIACTAYMANMRVLVYSLEMNEIQILRRCAAIISRVEYDKFKNGKLDPATMQRVFDVLYTLRDEELAKTNGGRSSALLATQPRSESSGIATLQAKIREFGPDLVIVDGMYLMKDDRVKQRTIDWKSIAHISQDLKRTASIMNVPIIGVTQANRSASKDPKQADLAELSYADALGQDCDLCMRVHKQKDTSTQENEIVLSFPGSREGVLDNFVIHGIPAVNFNYKRATVNDPNNPQSPPSAPSGGGGGGGRGSTKVAAVLPTTWRNP
jgi:replicative DNA helicase